MGSGQAGFVGSPGAPGSFSASAAFLAFSGEAALLTRDVLQFRCVFFDAFHAAALVDQLFRLIGEFAQIHQRPLPLVADMATKREQPCHLPSAPLSIVCLVATDCKPFARRQAASVKPSQPGSGPLPRLRPPSDRMCGHGRGERVDGEADEQISLDVYNAVWPHDAITMDEVRSFKASVVAYVDYLALLDRRVAGCAVGVVFPQRAVRVFTLVTVLPEHRRRGVGSALYGAVSAWTVGRGLRVLEAPVLDNDAESLAFGEARGFVEERRELGVVLRLSEIDPPPVEPPDGVQIVTWAQRPELARGMYEVTCEALPDIPAPRTTPSSLSRTGSRTRCRARATVRTRRFRGRWRQGRRLREVLFTAAQPTTAHHDLSGVKRAWRGEGVARALKAAQINWALANGYRELHTRNEQRNEPIRRLNAQFGYRPSIGRVYLVGPVATP